MSNKSNYVGLLLAIAGPLAILFSVSSLWLSVLTSVAIYALAILGIAVLYRRLGSVSLAHVALMGCGGWVTLRLSHGFGLPFEINILAGGFFTAFVGMILSYPALRMRGLYLALVTLMAAGGFSILINYIRFPNGGSGFTGFAIQSAVYIDRPAIATSDGAYFLYCCGIFFLGLLIMRAHENGKPGRAWALIRQSEASAIAAGVNVTLYKVWGFALSAFLAGIAGGLLAGHLQLLDVQSFVTSESVMLFALSIVGGSWHWYGAIIAALLFRFIPAAFNDFGVSGDAAYIFFGAALIHAIITAPTGIAGQLAGLFARIERKLGLKSDD